MQKIRACIFDMDGTLIDSMPAWRSLIPTFLSEHGIAMTDELAAALAGQTIRASSGILAQMLPSLGMSGAEILHIFYERMKKAYTTMSKKPGALRFLAHLRAQGIPCGVLTATDTDKAVPALAHQGMTAYLDFVITARDLGLTKAQPECFRLVAERLGVPCEACAMFEDALYAMRGAKAAGLRVFAISDLSNRKEWQDILQVSDAQFDSYDELTAPGGAFAVQEKRTEVCE